MFLEVDITTDILFIYVCNSKSSIIEINDILKQSLKIQRRKTVQMYARFLYVVIYPFWMQIWKNTQLLRKERFSIMFTFTFVVFSWWYWYWLWYSFICKLPFSFMLSNVQLVFSTRLGLLPHSFYFLIIKLLL